MENKVSGEVYIDVYLLLDKVKLRDCDTSLLDKCISLDMLIHEFDVNSYSIPDLYAETTQRVGDYISELKKQLPIIFDEVFGTFNLNALVITADRDIVVASSGRVWVKRELIAQVIGENPKFQIGELNRKVEEEIYDYLNDDVAGISPEFTFATVVPAIKEGQSGQTS